MTSLSRRKSDQSVSLELILFLHVYNHTSMGAVAVEIQRCSLFPTQEMMFYFFLHLHHIATVLIVDFSNLKLRRNKTDFYSHMGSSRARSLADMFYWFSISRSVKSVVISSRWLESHFKTKVLVCPACTVVCVCVC